MAGRSLFHTLSLIALFALAACNDASAGRDVSPQPTPAPPGFDLPAYCQAMCERTTSCGVDAAKASASMGGKATEDALAKVQSEAAAIEASCVEGCAAETVDPLDKSLARRAERCLQRSDCKELERCLGEL